MREIPLRELDPPAEAPPLGKAAAKGTRPKAPPRPPPVPRTPKGLRKRYPRGLDEAVVRRWHQPAFKLDMDKARRIRELAAQGATKKELAALYGVHPHTILAVLRGTIWTEGWTWTREGAKLDPIKARQIRERYAQGASKGELCRAYGVGRATITRVLRNQCYPEHTQESPAEAAPLAPAAS